MSSYNNHPVTINELMEWRRNKNVNPRTNKKIKETGKIYKTLNSEYNKRFPNGFDYLDSNDDKEPVTLNIIYEIKDNKKIFVFEKPDDLVLYKEGNIIRCLERTTIANLKKYNPYNVVHPISSQPIPEEILNMVKESVNINMTIKEKAFDTFQKFSKVSIFVDHNDFIKLSDANLSKLYYELQEFYYVNLPPESRKIIDKEYGTTYFNVDKVDFNNYNKNKKMEYIIYNIDNILNCEDEGLKFLINNIIIGALSLVIPKIKDEYGLFEYDF